MEWVLALISDLVIIMFDLTLYMKLTPFKWKNWLAYSLGGIGCACIAVAYSLSAYYYNVPYSLASFLCMTLPSLVLFFILSKYKNARFFVTFCFVDIISLVIAAFAKSALVIGGMVGAIVSCVIVIVLAIVILIVVWPYTTRYKKLMEIVPKGFLSMAICSLFIYVLLIFAAIYPKPLLERTEDIPVYLFICVTAMSFYAVFIILIKEKSKLIKTNELLKQQNHWKEMAYIDELTQLGNKAAYDMNIKSIVVNHNEDEYHLILLDVDSLKYVNDNFGHLTGDQVLKDITKLFKRIFVGPNYSCFRIGGDEFVIVCKNIKEEEINESVVEINAMKPNVKYKYSCSCGYSKVDFNQEDPFTDALAKADKNMYLAKFDKKEHFI